MEKVQLKFRLHKTFITLICMILIVVLMQGASYFSLSHQLARSEQIEELAQTLARQVAFSLTAIMNNSNNDNIDTPAIAAILNQLTHNSRILDASVYQMDGTLMAHAGEKVKIRNRLALDGKRAGSYFNHQIVEMIPGEDRPGGFLRLTLDTHVLATESRQVDNTTSLLRLMILIALAVGIVLAQTLLQHRRSRWQQSPYLLTANSPVEEDNDTQPTAARKRKKSSSDKKQ